MGCDAFIIVPSDTWTPWGMFVKYNQGCVQIWSLKLPISSRGTGETAVTGRGVFIPVPCRADDSCNKRHSRHKSQISSRSFPSSPLYLRPYFTFYPLGDHQQSIFVLTFDTLTKRLARGGGVVIQPKLLLEFSCVVIRVMSSRIFKAEQAREWAALGTPHFLVVWSRLSRINRLCSSVLSSVSSM